MDNSVPIALHSRVNSMEPWFIFAATVSYIAVIINMFVFCVLFKKQFMSPATVLLQGLAFADGLTALFMYGFEPLFFNKLIPISGMNYTLNRTFVTIEYPSCGLYVNVMLLACDFFHLMSVAITTCLGLQKVIAIQFPFWTKANDSVLYSIICCFICFFIPAGISTPLLTAQTFHSLQENGQDICWMRVGTSGMENYFHNYQPLIVSFIFIILCMLMLFSSFFITFKLCNNAFRQKMPKDMYKSIILVFIVLIIFLTSEIPRIIANITYITEISKIKEMLDNCIFRTVMSASQQDRKFFTFLSAIQEGEYPLDFNETDLTRARTFFEVVKFCTVLSSLTNFYIYAAMSKSFRAKFKAVFIWNGRLVDIKRYRKTSNRKTSQNALVSNTYT